MWLSQSGHIQKSGSKTLRVMLSSWICVGISARLDIAGPPAFSPVSHMIAGFLKKKREYRIFDVECRPQVDPLFQTPVVLPRQDGIPAGSTGRAGDKGMVEQNPFLGDAVECGRLNNRITIHTGMGSTPVIRKSIPMQKNMYSEPLFAQ